MTVYACRRTDSHPSHERVARRPVPPRFPAEGRLRAVMAGSALVVALAVAPPRAASQEVAMFRVDAAHTGVFAEPGLRSYGGLAWRAQTGGAIRSTPVIADGRLFIGGTDGHLYALEARTGEELWRFRAGMAVDGSPAVLDGTVYVTDHASTLYALDAASGDLEWSVTTGPDLPFPWGFESGDLYASSPTIAGGRVLFGSGDGQVYAVDARTGAVEWTAETGGRVRSTPAIADGRVYVGSADGAVYAFDADDGALVWRHETEGAGLYSGDFGYDRRTIQSSPAVADGRLFVGARDGRLYGLDADTGERLWRSPERISWVNGGPAVAEGIVYAATSDREFVQAVDAATGEELWRSATEGIVWTSPALAGGQVIVAEGAGRVRGLDRRTGETRWSAWVGHRLFGSPVPAGGLVYVGALDGGVYALRDGGESPLRRAVFWDSAYVNARWYADHESLARWLSVRGYEVLDAPALEDFLRSRVADRAPSAVVFALDHVPEAAAEGGRGSLFRRYLDAGGTVVWPSLVPLLWRRDPATGESGDFLSIDRSGAAEALSIDVDAANFDPLGAFSTPAGVDLGLPPDGWLTAWTIDPGPGLEPLATDGSGRLASWRRGYGGPPGTGLVRLWGARAPAWDPAAAMTAAELRPPVEVTRGSGATAEISRIDSFVHEAMSGLPGAPGLAVSIVRDGEILLEKGYGLRDVRTRLPVTPRTGFYIASSTKPYVATLVSALHERGMMDLDATLERLLPGIDLGGAADPSIVTLRDLLRHTTGFDNGWIKTRTAYTDPMDRSSILSVLATQSASVQGFDYSNLGFILAGLAVEDATGLPWRRALEHVVLDPVGLASTTGFVSVAADGELAAPHSPGPTGPVHRAMKSDGIMHAAGGLITTAEDAARWLQVNLGRGVVDGRRLLPEAVFERTLRTQANADDAVWRYERTGYGLGWFTGPFGAERTVHHFGGYIGFQTHISMIPGRDLGVAVLSNGGGAGTYLLPHLVAAYVYRTLLGEGVPSEDEIRAELERAAAEAEAAAASPDWQMELRSMRADGRRPAHDMAAYEGVYRSAHMGIVTVAAGPSGLYARWGHRQGPLVPLGGDGFLADWRPGQQPTRVRFTMEDGEASRLSWGDRHWERRSRVP